jgi:hypothetical protein
MESPDYQFGYSMITTKRESKMSGNFYAHLAMVGQVFQTTLSHQIGNFVTQFISP